MQDISKVDLAAYPIGMGLTAITDTPVGPYRLFGGHSAIGINACDYFGAMSNLVNAYPGDNEIVFGDFNQAENVWEQNSCAGESLFHGSCYLKEEPLK